MASTSPSSLKTIPALKKRPTWSASIVGESVCLGQGPHLSIFSLLCSDWDPDECGVLLMDDFSSLSKFWQVAFSPDGFQLACGGVDGQVSLLTWRRKRAVQLQVLLDPHTDKVNSIAWLPRRGSEEASEVFATASNDCTVRVWTGLMGSEELKAGFAPSKVLRGHARWVMAVGFVGESSLLSASDDGTLRLWDWRSPGSSAPLRVINTLGRVWSMAVSASAVALGGRDGSVRMLDASSLETLWERPHEHGRPVTALGFSGLHGLLLASGSIDKTVHLCDSETGAPVLRVDTASLGSSVRSVSFSASGTRLLVCCQNKVGVLSTRAETTKKILAAFSETNPESQFDQQVAAALAARTKRILFFL